MILNEVLLAWEKIGANVSTNKLNVYLQVEPSNILPLNLIVNLNVSIVQNSSKAHSLI